MNIQERLKNQIEKKKKETTTGELFKFSVDDLLNREILMELTKNPKELEILEKSSIDFLGVELVSALKKGEILENTFKELSSQGSGEALYGEWLNYINVSRTTAWRYRNRYKLCMMVNEEKKMFVSSFSNVLIKNILKFDDVDGVVEMINDNATLAELNEIVEEKKNQIEEKKEEYLLPFFNSALNFEKKISKMDFEDSLKLKSEIKELQKKLKKYEKEIDLKIENENSKESLK